MTLVEFLRARLRDRESDARNASAAFDPSIVLAEVEAKRRIVDECAYWYDKASMEGYPGTADRFDVAMAVLRLLALPYADHSDYRDEWRP